MNRNDMLSILMSKPNVKITHTYFDKDEYIYMGKDGNIYDENGYLFEDWHSIYRDGIRSRIGGYWETGWDIKKSK